MTGGTSWAWARRAGGEPGNRRGVKTNRSDERLLKGACNDAIERCTAAGGDSWSHAHRRADQGQRCRRDVLSGDERGDGAKRSESDDGAGVGRLRGSDWRLSGKRPVDPWLVCHAQEGLSLLLGAEGQGRHLPA